MIVKTLNWLDWKTLNWLEFDFKKSTIEDLQIINIFFENLLDNNYNTISFTSNFITITSTKTVDTYVKLKKYEICVPSIQCDTIYHTTNRYISARRRKSPVSIKRNFLDAFVCCVLFILCILYVLIRMFMLFVTPPENST